MTDEEIRKVVHGAVEDTLMHFGIEVEEPRKMQADLVFLRRQRLAQEAMGMRVKIGFVVTLVGMGLAAVAWAVKNSIGLGSQ